MRRFDLRTVLILGFTFGAILAGILQGIGEAVIAVSELL